MSILQSENMFKLIQVITRCNLRNLHPICSLFPISLTQKCTMQTTSSKLLFFEPDSKKRKPPTKEVIRNSLKQMKEEIKLWKEEIQEGWDGDFYLKGMPGVVDNVYEFKSEKDRNKWIVTSDKDNNQGDSTCKLELNPSGKGVFSGNLSMNVPMDGIIKRSGYCNIRTERYKRSFQRDSHMDWGMYTHLVMRVRGDGRTYTLNLSCQGYFDITWNDMYTFALFTRGGPYWQYSRIPFSKFFFTSKGKVQDTQSPVPLYKISSFGITLGERAPGPFRLEIDYIGLEYDPSHNETFAYEMYKVPRGLIGS